MRRRKLLIIALAVEATLLICLVAGAIYLQSRSAAVPADQFANLQAYRAEDLAQYNGEDQSKPIYIAVDGLVYDVTAGRKFYEPGGTYHYIAGKDATQDLGLFATAITGKYPVIGKLTD
jgi:predicted heme/steroid binding protein